MMQLLKYLLYAILLVNTHLYSMSATQSSTGWNGIAERAIDGNTNGRYSSLSTTHTQYYSTPYEWLLIDLEKTKILDGITLWNRTDCCSDRLASVYVMTSTTPFLPDTTEDALINALAQSNWHQQVVSITHGVVKIPFELNSTDAQYVLIQKAGPGFNVTNYLSLAEVEFTYKPSSDLNISKSAPNEVEQNSKFDYTLDIQNHGDTLAENVIVTDRLPVGVIYNGYSAPSGWSCNYSVGLISCKVDTFDVNQNAQIKIHAYAPDVTGDIINTATVKSDTPDPNMSNNSSSVTTSIIASNIDLSIIKNAPTSVNTTSQFDYTLTVSNNGSSVAKNIQVKDTLPNQVLFVSTSTDSSWVCSQGGTITCDYQGTLASGETTSAITITVTSPATEANVTNTASVTPNDNVPINNTATVSTQVNNNTNTGGDVNLTKYVQYNIFGDMLLLGNANLNFRGVDPQQGYNDNVNMQFVDTDNDATTFNSSSSTLNLPANTSIKQALLYWSGNLCTANSPGCSYTNMPNINVNNALTAARTIKLKTPSNNNYIDITANNFNTITRTVNTLLTHNKYTAFTDITRFLQPNESGTFTVANIPLTEGQMSSGGNYGGWGIIVVYEDNTTQTNYRNISIYNGFQNINSDGNTFPINGFVTPLSGPINASLSFFAADGDPATGGTGTMLNANTNLMQNLGGDALNPVTNLLNSTISTFGVATNTGVTKTYGIDLDRIDVSSFMTNNQNSTSFSFNISNPLGAGIDWYTLSMFTFITDLSIPIINDFEKTAELIDKNGSRPAGPGQPIYEGSEILYTLTFTNTGTEIAREVEVFDDFNHNNLQRALNLDNFDASKIKLSLPNSTQWQNNPNCGYTQRDLKVWCKIPQVDINDTYKMQFSVRIKDNLSGIDEDDRNLTNVAYANYKNATTGDYVILVSDNNGDFGGKSHVLDSGILMPSNHDPLILDAINANYDYDVDRNITTKIVNSPFALKLVHLDKEGNKIEYTSSYDMDVLLTLDNNESRMLTQGTIATFRDGESYILAENLNLSLAHKDDRVKMHYINWQDKILRSPIVCTEKELIHGIPKCLDSIDKLKKVFKTIPESATGCPVSIGTIYDHNYGCYHYLTSLSDDTNSTSTDNFSARPAKFLLSSTSGHYPDLLRAGSAYPLDIRAVDPSDTVVTDYTAQTSDINITKTLYFKTGEPSDLEDNSTKLWGDTNITDVNITQGIGSSNISFSDIGIVGITVVDSNWSLCDKDDTPQECNSSVNANGITIEASAYICSDETNLTFIPHHFDVNATLYNHRGGAFTYLVDPNTLNNMGAMSAHVGVDVAAKNEQNDTTKNFRTGSKYYEQPIAIDMNVTQWMATPISKYVLPNAQIDLNARVENNFTAIGSMLLDFGKDNGDDNGTHKHQPYDNINEWTEITTQSLKFNYAKVVNNPANPFTVNGADVNITVNTVYMTGTAPDYIADINGTTTAGGSATFIYGRIKAAENDDYFHGVPVGGTVNTPIMAMAYCDTTAVNCANFNFLAQTNTQNWYRNTQHRQDLRDGNIVLTNAPVNSQPNIGQGGGIALTGIDLNVMTTCPAGAPQVLNINAIAPTSPWMKYVTQPQNPLIPFALPYNLYSVECVGASGWTGHGATGNVVGGGASNAGRNRMNW